jgi:chemotaxis protein methyltransferase CheR
MKNMLPIASDDFSAFRDLLKETSGLHFEESRSQSLHLALWQRLQHRGYDSYREYYNLLKFHPEGRLEIRELFDLITIGETYFFRNKAQFNALMTWVLPEIMERKASSKDKQIRVWSAGCSGGDEVYSIAIAMMEVLPSHEEWRISILGTDINRSGLARAKEAIYREKDIAHLPKEYLAKYFNVRGPAYALNPNVRALACFEYHNLAQDPFIHEKMQEVDILFCRNVTIYFDRQTTRRVIGKFHGCLAQGGYLFLGHSETLWQITHPFERMEFPQSFIYRKKLASGQEGVFSPWTAVPGIPLETATPIKERGADLSAFPKRIERGLQGKPDSLEQGKSPIEVQEKVESPYRETAPGLKEMKDPAALLCPKSMTVPVTNPMLAYLTKATILANQAKYKEAAQLLAKVIETDNLSVEAYYLLGTLLYKNRRLKEAETQFKKVIYASPDTVLAYFNLGNMYCCQRKFREAAREFKNAIRLLEKRPKSEQVRFCEDVTVGFLLKACRNHLVEISKKGESYE